MKVTTEIQRLFNQNPLWSTEQILTMLGHRFSKRQITGGIGYLRTRRSPRRLMIVAKLPYGHLFV